MSQKQRLLKGKNERLPEPSDSRNGCLARTSFFPHKQIISYTKQVLKRAFHCEELWKPCIPPSSRGNIKVRVSHSAAAA